MSVCIFNVKIYLLQNVNTNHLSQFKTLTSSPIPKQEIILYLSEENIGKMKVLCSGFTSSYYLESEFFKLKKNKIYHTGILNFFHMILLVYTFKTFFYHA